MQRETKTFGNGSQCIYDQVSHFLQEKSGATLYEFALLASLIAVVSIIVLVALDLGK